MSMSKAQRSTMAILSCLLSATCDRSESPTRQLASSDSPGVENVESVSPAWAPGQEWQIAAVPTVVVVRSECQRANVERRYRDHPTADYMPAHGTGLIVDVDDNIWVEGFEAPSDSVVEWSIFSPLGQFLGSIGLPSVFQISDIGDDYVLGIWRDALDVESLRVYELTKP
jgi:hypothetical protein